MRKNELKDRLYNGACTLGLFATIDSTDLIELAGLCGFDFVMIDCEHGVFTPEAVRRLIIAAELRGITPLVRIPEKTEAQILSVLDMGVYGLLAPDVASVEEAERIVGYAKYHPEGYRSMSMPRAANYGMMTEEYHQFANRNTMVAVQCESVSGMEHLRAVCRVDGIDMIFVGPFDMSQSLGIPGQVDAPQVQQIVAEALEIILAAGRIPGIFAVDEQQARRYREMGFRFIIVRSDIDYFADACRQMLKQIRESE